MSDLELLAADVVSKLDLNGAGYLIPEAAMNLYNRVVTDGLFDTHGNLKPVFAEILRCGVLAVSEDYQKDGDLVWHEAYVTLKEPNEYLRKRLGQLTYPEAMGYFRHQDKTGLQEGTAEEVAIPSAS